MEGVQNGRLHGLLVNSGGFCHASEVGLGCGACDDDRSLLQLCLAFVVRESMLLQELGTELRVDHVQVLSDLGVAHSSKVLHDNWSALVDLTLTPPDGYFILTR